VESGGRVSCHRCEKVFSVNLDIIDPLNVYRLARQISKNQSGHPEDAESHPVELPAIPPAPVEMEPRHEPETFFNPFEPRYHAPTKTKGGWWKGLLLIILCLLFLTQVLWIQREQWLQEPRIHTIVTNICSLLGCQPPPLRHPESFVILQREVSTHPQDADTLNVQLAFKNTAHFAQAYPTLKLSFFDYTDTEIASRLIHPAEYRKGTAESVGPDMIVTVDILIEGPGLQAAGYQFDLL